MPELPEVETFRRVLEPQLRGRRIRAVRVAWPEIVAHPGAEEFARALAGQVFERIERRGKFLRLCLASGDRVALHLRMTGCLLLAPTAMEPERHTHLTFDLENGMELRYSDPRRFGRFWLLRCGEEDTYSGIGRLGIEPFDARLTAEYLREHFGGRRKAIKECLLEQGVVAGIGNIYSDEILFAAGIRPMRQASSLSDAEWGKLAEVIPERLRFFIEKNAISAEDYLRTRGQEYRNTPYLKVYGHAGEACPTCGETLCRMVIGGRSSVYCQACQK